MVRRLHVFQSRCGISRPIDGTVWIPLDDTLHSEGTDGCSVLNTSRFCIPVDNPWRLIRINPSNQSPPSQIVLKVKFKVDYIVDAITAVDQASMPTDEDVAVTAWRRR